MSRRKDSAAQPEVTMPRTHEAINTSGKAVQELLGGGGRSPKVWLAKMVIGLAGGSGGGENAIPRLGLQACRD